MAFITARTMALLDVYTIRGLCFTTNDLKTILVFWLLFSHIKNVIFFAKHGTVTIVFLEVLDLR